MRIKKINYPPSLSKYQRSWSQDGRPQKESADFDKANPMVLLLHVKLRGFRCYADVLVRENFTFEQLHQFLNSLFERDDDHLYRFECDDGCICVSTQEELEDKGNALLTRNCYIGHHLTKGSQGYYLFDYGDEWEHDITVKEVMPADSETQYPQIVKLYGRIPEQYPEY